MAEATKTALLIIDVQYGVFMGKHYHGKAVYREDEFLGNLKQLIQRARVEKAHVIYIQHMYDDFPLMAKGEPFWDVHPQIKPEPDDLIIEKHHADAFLDTRLSETLESLGVTNLVIAGLQTEYCVDTTCRRAFSMGYQSVLVSDGHSTLGSDTLTSEQIIAHHNEVLGSQFAALRATHEVSFAAEQ